MHSLKHIGGLLCNYMYETDDLTYSVYINIAELFIIYNL